MKKSFALALISCAGFLGNASAQSPSGARSPSGATETQPRAQTQSQAAPGGQAQASQGGALQKHIAVCLILGNQEEAALGQFAQDRAQHDQVKQFAQMMAEEHQQANAKIQQAVPQLASMDLKLTATEGNAGSAPGQGTRDNQRQSATGAQAGGQDQMVQFAKQVKQECLNLTQAELGRKQGAEFDKCYIAQQIVAHTGMLAHLRASQQHVSNELQPIIQEGTKMTEHHLAQARQIMEQLENEGGARSANASSGAAGQAQRRGSPTPPRR